MNLEDRMSRIIDMKYIYRLEQSKEASARDTPADKLTKEAEAKVREVKSEMTELMTVWRPKRYRQELALINLIVFGLGTEYNEDIRTKKTHQRSRQQGF
jgi:hypothetical protein